VATLALMRLLWGWLWMQGGSSSTRTKCLGLLSLQRLARAQLLLLVVLLVLGPLQQQQGAWQQQQRGAVESPR
jgi:hypothetical protein